MSILAVWVSGSGSRTRPDKLPALHPSYGAHLPNAEIAARTAGESPPVPRVFGC